eukprot:CAMPEP_0194549766 /NCGR_PEP_ID=MMETSP0253-20130528/95372_1 /TAXON_ID=2966 /ORGANISM="Noctiluca scintillans" /LENGTH=215 /DNA_ID=CAMNT_0039397199 /DNA_START=86 /DNA_END=734 /DNA_ORIENTATION=-
MSRAGQHKSGKRVYGSRRKNAAVNKVKKTAPVSKLRTSIQPGSVLILLGGQFRGRRVVFLKQLASGLCLVTGPYSINGVPLGVFRGRRVVFLKQLASGLCLVTGPYSINGVPLRRVNQRFLIATSTKVDLSGADFSAIDDTFFAREATKEEKPSTATPFADASKTGSGPSDEKKTKQKAVDAAIVKSVQKDAVLKAYLKAKFALSNASKPHAMVF